MTSEMTRAREPEVWSPLTRVTGGARRQVYRPPTTGESGGLAATARSTARRRGEDDRSGTARRTRMAWSSRAERGVPTCGAAARSCLIRSADDHITFRCCRRGPLPLRHERPVREYAALRSSATNGSGPCWTERPQSGRGAGNILVMWRRHHERRGLRGSSWGFYPPRVGGNPRRCDIDAVWRGGRADARRRGTVVPNLSPQLKVDDFESVEAREPETWHRRRRSPQELGSTCTDHG